MSHHISTDEPPHRWATTYPLISQQNSKHESPHVQIPATTCAQRLGTSCPQISHLISKDQSSHPKWSATTYPRITHLFSKDQPPHLQRSATTYSKMIHIISEIEPPHPQRWATTSLHRCATNSAKMSQHISKDELPYLYSKDESSPKMSFQILNGQTLRIIIFI